MNWLAILPGVALLFFAAWALFRSGGAPRDDKGRDEDNARGMGPTGGA
jgi:hypothetical protein